MMRRKFLLVCLLGLLVPMTQAKETPGQTVVWPENGQPILRFVLGS